MFANRILDVNDARTLKPVKLTDGERVLLAGLIAEHVQWLAEDGKPRNAVEASEHMNEILAGIKLKRRLWEGVTV